MRRGLVALTLALSLLSLVPSGALAASYGVPYHGDSGVDCWLSDHYGISLHPVTMYATNTTAAQDWQMVGWVPALYQQGNNGTWNLLVWGTWTTYTSSDIGRPDIALMGLGGGGGGQWFSIPRTMQGNYRIAILYRWFAKPGVAQLDRFEWLGGPYLADGAVGLYSYCAFSQGTAIIGGR